MEWLWSEDAMVKYQEGAPSKAIRGYALFLMYFLDVKDPRTL